MSWLQARSWQRVISGLAIAGLSLFVSLDGVKFAAPATAASYSWNYSANGGGGTMTMLESFSTCRAGGEALGGSSSPTRSGYTLVGWSVSSASGNFAGANGARYVNCNTITLYAQWNYRVTFDPGGGTVTPETLTNSTVVGQPVGVTLPTPARSGYTFNGWYTAASGGSRVGGAGDQYNPNANITIYAQWTAATYTVTYNANEGSVSPASATFTTGGAELVLPTPTRDEFNFQGWYTDSTGGTLVGVAGAGYTPSASITIYAQWSAMSFCSSTSSTVTSGGINYTLLRFTTATGCFWTVPSGVSTIDYLLVGGGGGGGSDNGSGGGGGGLREVTSASVTPGAVTTVVVGAGGAGGVYTPLTSAIGGGASSLKIGSTTTTATGGGRGLDSRGGFAALGGAGGSGTTSGGNGGQSPAGITLAGTVGGNGNSSSITGSIVTYGGGGGGGIYTDLSTGPIVTLGPVAGGLGGGGAGASANSGAVISNAVAGTTNLGGGGGAGSAGKITNGANGGSGLVVIRYVTPTPTPAPAPEPTPCWVPPQSCGEPIPTPEPTPSPPTNPVGEIEIIQPIVDQLPGALDAPRSIKSGERVVLMRREMFTREGVPLQVRVQLDLKGKKTKFSKKQQSRLVRLVRGDDGVVWMKVLTKQPVRVRVIWYSPSEGNIKGASKSKVYRVAS
jgi:uncharacterized repeat protein (TIGR02543 family)